MRIYRTIADKWTLYGGDFWASIENEVLHVGVNVRDDQGGYETIIGLIKHGEEPDVSWYYTREHGVADNPSDEHWKKYLAVVKELWDLWESENKLEEGSDSVHDYDSALRSLPPQVRGAL